MFLYRIVFKFILPAVFFLVDVIFKKRGVVGLVGDGLAVVGLADVGLAVDGLAGVRLAVDGLGVICSLNFTKKNQIQILANRMG